jgi:beta-alanine degradation protein BauB
MRARVVICLVVAAILLTATAVAQDALKVDPKHYTLVSENAKVRILKIHYGPHEKSVMHSHPDSVVIPLSDLNAKFTMPDGKTETHAMKAGEAQFTPAGTHLPENTSDKAFEAILVELKGGAAKPAAAPAAAAAKPEKAAAKK